MPRLPIALALAASLALTALATAQTASAPTEMTAEAREELREEIRAYLLDNPELILEAINILEERRKQATEETDADRVAAHAQALFENPDSWVGGNPEGDVTVVEFLDYRCGFCKRAHPVIARLLEEDPNVRLVIKEFPILGPESVTAGRLALAALKQDREKYIALHDALMEHRGPLTEVAAYRIAKEAGYDLAALKTRTEDPAIDAQLQETYALAEALGLQGTPSFVIGDRIIRGFLEYDAMAATVAEVRAARSQ